MALAKCHQSRPAQAFCFRYPQNPAKIFLYDRRLLLELSRCIWESLKIYYPHFVPGNKSIPGAAIAVQTFGDFLIDYSDSQLPDYEEAFPAPDVFPDYSIG
jgi:hypothetical protein